MHFAHLFGAHFTTNNHKSGMVLVELKNEFSQDIFVFFIFFASRNCAKALKLFCVFKA
jgi:hypothetical protein